MNTSSYPPEPRRRVKPITSLSRAVVAILIPCASLDVWALIEAHRLRSAANSGIAYHLPGGATRPALLNLVDVFLFQAAVAVPTAILFVIWFRRAYRNLPGLGISGVRGGRGWPVWGWLVPLLNLVVPLQIMNDIWQGSDPRVRPGSALPRDRRTLLIPLWWGALIGSVGLAAWTWAVRPTTTQDDLLTLTTFVFVIESLSLLAALCALAIVSEVGMRQAERAAVLAGAPIPGGGRPTRLLTHPAFATSGRAASIAPRDVERLRTPGGKRCPSCGFENHQMAVACLSCFKRC
ncbi:MAG TPA: DUF4328 domain-containing protein [Gaiellaceae bacterium]